MHPPISPSWTLDSLLIPLFTCQESRVVESSNSPAPSLPLTLLTAKTTPEACASAIFLFFSCLLRFGERPFSS